MLATNRNQWTLNRIGVYMGRPVASSDAAKVLVLGHAQPSVTQNVNMGRKIASTKAVIVLEQLA